MNKWLLSLILDCTPTRISHYSQGYTGANKTSKCEGGRMRKAELGLCWLLDLRLLSPNSQLQQELCVPLPVRCAPVFSPSLPWLRRQPASPGRSPVFPTLIRKRPSLTPSFLWEELHPHGVWSFPFSLVPSSKRPGPSLGDD